MCAGWDLGAWPSNNTGGEKHTVFFLCSVETKGVQSPLSAGLLCMRMLIQLLLFYKYNDVARLRLKPQCSFNSQELIGSASGLTDTPVYARGLRPFPQDHTKGLRRRLQVQIVPSVPGCTSVLQEGLLGQQVDRFDPGYSKHENF